MGRWQLWLGLGLVLLGLLGCSKSSPAPTSPPPAPKRYTGLPRLDIDPQRSYTAVVKTNKGEFHVELFASTAPQTVNSFVFLARDGYYNGAPFHRVIKDFMVQTGDPTGTGAGGPGYNVPDELPARFPYEPGIVAMANTGDPNTGGSQFFICTGDGCRGLQRQPIYTQFGRVVKGMDVVQAIAAVPVGPTPRGELSKPKADVHISGIAIQDRPGGA